jgi:hypothetical protein
MAGGGSGGGDYGQQMQQAEHQGKQVQTYGNVFGDVMGFIGAMLAQDASTKSAQSDMAQLDEDARIAQVAAGDAVRRGNIEAGKLRMQGTQAVAQQAVAYTGAGVDATVGTPADNAKATAAATELDAQVAANNAAREAWGYQKQSEKFQRQRQSRLDEWSAQNTQYNLNQIGRIGKFGFDAAGTE